MAPQHRYTDHHKREILDAKAWHKVAMDLIDSARHLYPRVEEYWRDQKTRTETQRHVAAFMMLCGFAVENLLKALIILTKRKVIEGEIDTTCKLPSCLKTHDLNALVRQADIEPGLSAHKNLLQRLTRAAKWQGRYPCPLLAEQWEMKDPFGVAGDEWVPMSAYCSTDADDIKAIVNVIVTRMNAQQSAAPLPPAPQPGPSEGAR